MNAESAQSSMAFPSNLKYPFGSSINGTGEFSTSTGLFSNPPLINNQGFLNDNIDITNSDDYMQDTNDNGQNNDQDDQDGNRRGE